MLFAVPALDGDDQRVLAEIDAFHRAFSQATGGASPREWVGGVRKRSLAGAIRGSTTIEGFTVDQTAATAVVEGAALAADVPQDTRDAVTGYRDALTWVLRTPDMPFFQHGETVLSLLHFTMTRTAADASPGRYRTRNVVVTGADPLTPAYVAPPPEDVPGLMGEFAEWLEHGDLDAHLLVRGALAHLDLVSIHPWRDGNGRMSRCVQTLVIARGGRTAPEFCSIEEWLGHDINTLAYYQALRSTRGTYEPERDVHDWLRFCLRAHHVQAQIVDRRLEYGREVWRRVEEIVERHGFDDRVVAALYAAATGDLRRETYQREEGLSRDQAIRDIRALERSGLVTAVGYGATLTYTAAGEAREAAEDVAARLTAPAVEPYEPA